MNQAKLDLRILVRGANDVGSAVAHRLFTEGYSVVIHEISQPTTARRRMSFTDAVFDGSAMLDGVEAQLLERLYLLRGILALHAVIPIWIKDFYELMDTLRPQIVVDARMRKRAQPEVQRGLAPLVIGLGPNFIDGKTVHLAIETGWDSLGKIVTYGETKPLEGEPREIEGHARDRYVYAPRAGIFHTALQIGNIVQKDEEVARIDSTLLLVPITGMLRGLTRDNIFVPQKTKVIEIDPRSEGAQISGIGERPARIAEGVLTAIQHWEEPHVH
jgi:xanthine dehydrogenase accessory factor